MKFSGSRIAIVVMGMLAVAALLVFSRPAASQSASGKCFGCAVDGKTPMTADGHPDLSGVWGGGFGGGAGGAQFQRAADGSILFDFNIDMGNEAGCYSDDCQAPNQPPYNAAYMTKVKAIAKTEFLGTTGLDPTKNCEPAGVPRSGFGGMVIQTPLGIAMLKGDYTDRFIYTDGRPHPADLDDSYMGDSIGHWEGNTLVVDTVGLNDATWLGGGGSNTIYTSIHSNKEHVTERWTRDGDTISIETTVEDPVAFTKPWVLPVRKAVLNKDPMAVYPQAIFCDGGGISSIMRDHYVLPNPEDKDVKYKCSAHRCDDPSQKVNCNLANKQNCGK